MVASLEYLARPGDRRRGGLNNWEISGRALHVRSPRLARVLDLVADRRTTTALHALRVPVALSLMAPTGRGARLAADATLAGTSAALYPRHHYGTDGSDQVSFLVQSVAAFARAAQRNPRVVDAALWYASLQAVLSYAVSGWAKLAGPSWRSGDALTGVTRTLTYGDPVAWKLFHRHPRAARLLGTSVVAMECTFPIVFAGRGRLAPPMLAAASAFHAGNARIMGLGRFVWAFLSMHPPCSTRAGRASGPTRAGASSSAATTRCPRSPRPPGRCADHGAARPGQPPLDRPRGPRRRAAPHRPLGNVLRLPAARAAAHRRAHDRARERPDRDRRAGREWIASGLAERFPTVTYNRAGYAGPSSFRARGPYSLDVAVADLADLVRHVGGARPVVVVGHSLGGWLALRRPPRRPSTSPASACSTRAIRPSMQRSTRQAQGQEVLSSSLSLMPISLSLGLGALLERPDWLDSLPEEVRRLALAQYRDPRLWAAGRREWRATVSEFGAFDGRLPTIGVPLLVMTAGLTATNDPIQQELHRELAAAAAPSAEMAMLEGADHDQVLTHPKAAGRVVEHIAAFAAGLPDHTEEVTRDVAPAR